VKGSHRQTVKDKICGCDMCITVWTLAYATHQNNVILVMV